MDHPYKHTAFESVFIYTKVISDVDFLAKSLQKLHKMLSNPDAFNIMQIIYPFTLLIKHYCITETHFAFPFLSYF